MIVIQERYFLLSGLGGGPQENYFDDLRPFSKKKSFSGFRPSTGANRPVSSSLSLHSRACWRTLWCLVHMEVHLSFSAQLGQIALDQNARRQRMESPGRRNHELPSHFRGLHLDGIL